MEFAREFIGQYGYFAIYGLLALGVIGMPIPDEVMMTFVGYLASISVLNYSVSIVVSFGGAFTGGLLSYTIGKKAGRPLVEKYGKWVGVNAKRLGRVESWFLKYGYWSIILGYFIPGIRHLMCCFSGISRMAIGRYVLFSSIGAFIWCVVFISIGFYVGVLT
ncbi:MULTISPECIES: DedA family protein [Paenibacillus]|uniref:DedA family protein n=1 Tax=Paenibacillus TaxID=44249 RepID=UPI0007BEDE0D|nr:MULTISPECIES: DedA family protein [Paenibacillus]MCZ1264672.1 DedA family protein [Paenibacillus tundrae]OAX51065.1 Inner membrane protein YqjA [Paenibacillus sp. AD87]WDQ32953.1 DedA family protein [Paenibacillus marchantiae]SDM09301.1 membrane protein DedA, SNARE-associated domain [Paenibacillus sp. OK060]SEB27806.1 membrane protein DedA, SNARE-associated domain [Paenibacillus sp. 276b]